jgi:hypothetical protein
MPGIVNVALRPGFAVQIKCPVEGGVTYRVQPILADAPSEGGESVAKWETTRITADAAEHAAAVALRAKVRNGLTAHCYRVGVFGLMADAPGHAALAEATIAAHAEVDAFNASARTCRISLGVLSTVVRSDDAETVRAIRSEIGSMLREVDAGIKAADPERIRKACNEARVAGQALSADASQAVADAVEAARKVARDMVKRVKESGEGAADTLRTIKLDALRDARIAFLDLDPAREESEVMQAPRLLDMTTEAPGSPMEAPAAAPRPVDAEDLDAANLTRIDGIIRTSVPARSFDLDL